MSAERGAELRAVAAEINARVVRDGISLEHAMHGPPSLEPRDLSLLRSMSYGVLRWHHRLEWQSRALLSRPLKRSNAELAALLRLGLLQLQWLRIPDHAAVSATVAAADLIGAKQARGLVNAVLRRFLRERDELDRRMTDEPAAFTSHPLWMLDLLQSDWPDDWENIVAAGNREPAMWLRVNERRIERDTYLERLADSGIAAAVGMPTGSAILLEEPRPMNTLPGYDDGLVSVQDAAAQLAVSFLDLAPGQRVLDACAAPGGKSAHILEACPGLGELVSVDREPERLAVVRASYERLGLEGAVIQGDAAEPSGWWDGRPFERVLLDAPCSALGVIRRHPDIKILRRASDIETAASEQRRLLRGLWPLVAPAGKLVYAVCTMTERETQCQISDFLANTSDAELTGAGGDAGRQILPGEANMDGFYYACLDKKE